MINETLFLGFISNILNIKAVNLAKTSNALTNFEKECCFERTLQPMYTKEYLSFLLENMASNTLYEITDYLNTSLILFCFEGEKYAVGPYVKTSFSQSDMQQLLASHKLPASILLSLKLYYGQFPQLGYTLIQGTVMAAMRTFVPNTPDYAYRRLTGFHEDIKSEKLIVESNRTYAQIIQQYEIENFFLRKITDGDVIGVRMAFENIVSSFYISSNQSERTLYTTNSNGFAILRTLARKAAEAGGASVVKIDEITKESIQRYDNARSGTELEAAQKDMLIELTQAVADAKMGSKYSPVIRDTLRYILANYTQDITLPQLAARHHISNEHLSRLFKKEIGDTITDYIANLRVKKAAELLKSSELSISEISMYVGYPDSNYFVKKFKKRYGMTPSTYRRL